MLTLERTRKSFEERIKIQDPETQAGYKLTLNNFENFCMEKYGKIDIIDELRGEIVWDVLQAWINWCGKHPRTVRNWFSHIKRYLHYRGIKLDPMDIKENLIFPKILQEEYYPLQIEEIRNILENVRIKTKRLHLCQLSSLMRIGELVQLRKKDLIIDKRIIVKIPPSIAKFGRGRTTFFSSEASKLLIPHLKKLDDNSLVFGTNENPKHSEIICGSMLRRTLDKLGLNMKYETNSRYKINTHSFRAYGITKISRHDPNFAKMLAGQKGYLIREYDRMTEKEKLDLYIKLEKSLLIYSSIPNDENLLKRLETMEEQMKSLKSMAKKQWIDFSQLFEQKS